MFNNIEQTARDSNPRIRSVEWRTKWGCPQQINGLKQAFTNEKNTN